jgi:hypothetical protein
VLRRFSVVTKSLEIFLQEEAEMNCKKNLKDPNHGII